LGDKITSEIVLRDENNSSLNNVFIIILRTYFKATTTTTSRILAESTQRILETSSQYGTLYISDGKVNEEGEPAPFNWLLFVVVPACSVAVLGLVGIIICCCCCKKKESETISHPKKAYAEQKKKDPKPVESQRTIHDGSNRDVAQPIYMPSDRSLGGKPIPLDSRKDIPKTQENSLILDNSINTPNRSRENSPDSYRIPDRTPDRTPDRSPDRTPDRTPDMTPERRRSRDNSDNEGRYTPSKSPKRRVARRRYDR